MVLNNAPLELVGDLNPAPLVVEGFTSPNSVQPYAVVSHDLPIASGNISAEAHVQLPFLWVCVAGCYTRTSWFYDRTIDIGVRNLAVLPNNQNLYLKVRGEDAFHLDEVAFYGAAITLQMLPLVAQDYLLLSGITLSANDMSLPKGGLFDIRGDWDTPHSSHREGRDADINRGVFDCFEDLELRTAVDQLLRRVTQSNGTTRSALLCEPCGRGPNAPLCRKHIDFELQ